MKETEKRSYKIRVSNACYIRGHCALISVNASLQFLPERKNCKDADQTNHQRRAVRNGDRNSGRRWRNVCDETAKALQIQTYLTPCLYVTILHAGEFGGFRTIKNGSIPESCQKRVPEKRRRLKMTAFLPCVSVETLPFWAGIGILTRFSARVIRLCRTARAYRWTFDGAVSFRSHFVCKKFFYNFYGKFAKSIDESKKTRYNNQ